MCCSCFLLLVSLFLQTLRFDLQSNDARQWISTTNQTCAIRLLFLLVDSDKELQVTVRGQRPDNLLFVIHEVLETLVAESFKGVSYEYLIPCPDCVDRNVSIWHTVLFRPVISYPEFNLNLSSTSRWRQGPCNELSAVVMHKRQTALTSNTSHHLIFEARWTSSSHFLVMEWGRNLVFTHC